MLTWLPFRGAVLDHCCPCCCCCHWQLPTSCSRNRSANHAFNFKLAMECDASKLPQNGLDLRAPDVQLSPGALVNGVDLASSQLSRHFLMLRLKRCDQSTPNRRKGQVVIEQALHAGWRAAPDVIPAYWLGAHPSGQGDDTIPAASVRVCRPELAVWVPAPDWPQHYLNWVANLGRRRSSGPVRLGCERCQRLPWLKGSITGSCCCGANPLVLLVQIVGRVHANWPVPAVEAELVGQPVTESGAWLHFTPELAPLQVNQHQDTVALSLH